MSVEAFIKENELKLARSVASNALSEFFSDTEDQRKLFGELADFLGIWRENCRIALFTKEQCDKVLEFVLMKHETPRPHIDYYDQD